MVSKVAVMAIVGILAIPIILGYAMNYESVQTTGYTEQGQSVDVSDMLASGTRYSYIAADPYSLNADNFIEGYSGGYALSFYPTYDETASPTYSPLYMKTSLNENGSMPARTPLDVQRYYSANVDYLGAADQDNGSARIVIRDGGGNTVADVDKVVRVLYDEGSATIRWWCFVDSSSSTLTYGSYENPDDIRWYQVGSFSGRIYQEWLPKSLTATDAVLGNESIDIAKGFRLMAQYDNFNDWIPPARAESVLFTVDLDDTSASNYTIQFRALSSLANDNYITFRKVNNEWEAVSRVQISPGQTSTTTFDIGYDSSRSNVYQVLFTLDHAEIRRVVSWPKTMGFANYYLKVDIDWPDIPEYDDGANLGGIGGVKIDTNPSNDWNLHANGLLMRFDYATVRGFTAPVILNETYEPALLKSNPITKITGLVQPGYSITFGGSTFNVSSDKTITIGSSRPIPLEGMKFSSTPNETDPNQFDNKINGTIISTTNDPSSIVFNGQWAVNVRTDSMVEETVTEYKWVPGSFAWDGIDSNFLIVGLLGCLGVFIGLSIYCRNSNRSIWPVVIVCIGGMLIFIAMA